MIFLKSHRYNSEKVCGLLTENRLEKRVFDANSVLARTSRENLGISRDGPVWRMLFLLLVEGKGRAARFRSSRNRDVSART